MSLPYIHGKSKDISLETKPLKKAATRHLAALQQENALLKALLAEQSSLSEAAIEKLLAERKDFLIPLSVFYSPLSTLENIVLWLKETQQLDFTTIAGKLERDQRTVGDAYRRALRKKARLLAKSAEQLPTLPAAFRTISVPLSFFAKRDAAPLETLVFFLRTVHQLTFTEIAQALQRSPKTMWTIQQRAKKKYEKKRKDANTS
ncbi:MAG: hypothetical protein Q8R53_06470 [Nanoarchaeota archaeon]|nr:hypothetical protein [Nanoarchaeota archaeon]